jgi:ATP synthase in type III secretion protein N
MALPLDGILARLDAAPPLRAEGRVEAVSGLAIRASLPGAFVGEHVVIARARGGALGAEVVGLERDRAVLLAHGETGGLSTGDAVKPSGHPLRVPVGSALLGRVVDGLGRPLDDGPALAGSAPISAEPPPALERPLIGATLATGIRAIDGLLTLGRGQRVGLFAGSGVGKSSLLAQIARQTEAEAFVVALVGERGREVREFLEEGLGPEGRARGVVVVATSDRPALERMRAVDVATRIAESLRDEGKDVLLLVDSVTRFARAAREVGLSAGEPPTRRAFPPSVFAALPRLLERAGLAERGSITALYTVLVEAGDLDEPIADEIRGILDGHIVLDRALASRGHFPAIDVLASLSRLFPKLASGEHQAAAARLRALLAALAEKLDLHAMGAYEAGRDPLFDRALARRDAIDAFLRQGPLEREAFETTVRRLIEVSA